MTTTTVAMEQQSLSKDITNDYLEPCFDVLNDIEIDDLESIMTIAFAQGLPSDTEHSGF